MDKEIRVKVSIKTEDQEASFIEDYTDYAKDLIDYGNSFGDGRKMSDENILEFFSNGAFLGKDIEDTNGNHFIYGFVEALTQSERCPEFLFAQEKEIIITTEIL